MGERSFFGAFILAGAVAIGVALWAFQLKKEKNATSIELRDARNELDLLARDHDAEVEALNVQHAEQLTQQLAAAAAEGENRIAELRSRQAARMAKFVAQYNLLVSDEKSAIDYVNTLEQRLLKGEVANDEEIEQVIAIASALTTLSNQYQGEIPEFTQLGNYFAEQATQKTDAPRSRIAFLKRIFSKEFRAEERAYQQDVARQQAYQEAYERFRTTYASAQAAMRRNAEKIRAQADKLMALADRKMASYEDLDGFFKSSRPILEAHKEVLRFDPDLPPAQAAP